MISNKTKYALKAMLYMAARHGSQEPALTSEISEREGIPRKFLEVILLQLKNKGLLTSRKGKGGGYLLARTPDQISFGDVIRVFEGSMAPVPCVEPGRIAQCPECQGTHSCAIRTVMRELYNVTVGIMDGTSLERANERSARVEFSNMYYI
ncbi:MAG TPA: Rrf2 family transcriptional regulator [Candidatus Omnitrophota bacterium]|jgi:Rrf2 family protein|nr:MAG: HTH-type transcriptional regulator CymR [Candidatus Omnitrophica bacterium ADurb.Bin314]HOE68780.1 Rrf2 family transcriptional regulator [Candidatus Omnitrophota bacterium]HQB94809.1 Rrf2 family transcriptional regulator [Candidatus Omnitrophota bacterium]